VNLIFVLANHAAVSFLFEFSLLVLTTRQPLASTHFDPPVNFLDLFLPINIASADRARAFLWLIFHYLEGPDQPNPYDDDYSRQNPGKVPWLHRLTEEEMAQENVDTPDEIEWGKAMSAQRNLFLQRLVHSIEKEKKVKAAASASKCASQSLIKLSANH
jgi:Ino eighty subunit 1